MENSNTSFYMNGATFYAMSVVLAYCMDGNNEIQETVTSFETLISRLQIIKKEAKEYISIPFSVDIVVKDKGYISVGLGENESIIIWYVATDDVYLTSLGDEQAVGTKLYYFGDWSELPAKHTISWEAALSVIKAWIGLEDINDCINWIS